LGLPVCFLFEQPFIAPYSHFLANTFFVFCQIIFLSDWAVIQKPMLWSFNFIKPSFIQPVVRGVTPST
jgi:hypothetical protein